MTRNEAITELKSFTKASNTAWRRMMNGTETDARTVFGEEGRNYVAWCAAADAECKFRQEHELLDWPTRRRSN
jgi:hypothetical protein